MIIPWLLNSTTRESDVIMGSLALPVAAIIFSVDTFTHVQSAVAVLYVIVLLLASEWATRTGLAYLTAICGGLATTSYLTGHGTLGDFQSVLRLCVTLTALCITTALMLRHDEARSKLRVSEARYRAIFDRTRVALWERDYSAVRNHLMELKDSGVTDLRQYVAVNPQSLEQMISLIGFVAANEAALEMLGPNAGRDPSKALKHSTSAPGNAAFISMLQAILDGGKSFEDRAEVVTETGDIKSVLISVNFPEDPAAFDRVVLSMTDITLREQAQQALNEAQSRLTRASRAATVGALSASLAHELNQPLGAIAVNSSTLIRWLDRDPPDVQAAKRSAERILRDTDRASAIIHNTRQLLSKSEMPTEELDLPQVIEETLCLMEEDLKREGATVDVIIRTKIPLVHFAKIEIQQVLINLITNAAQAMSGAACRKRNVTVSLTVSPDNTEIVIGICDTGPGLDENASKKIFSPFFTTKERGMGMGLSICRSTIEAKGGSLEGSNAPDGGALFEIKLPNEGLVSLSKRVSLDESSI